MEDSQNFNKTLEGLTNLSSESLQKQVTGDVKKTRVRYSGAARRRYKKLMMKGSDEAGKPRPEPKSSVVSTPKTQEQIFIGENKCPRQELNTPSPSDTQQPRKRSKVEAQRSFAQATSGVVKVAIVPIAYPDRQLNKQESDELKEHVEGRILGLARGARAPTFKGTYDRDGAIIFNCTDEQTSIWLKTLTSEFSLKNGTQLRVLRIDELPKRHRVMVHVENPKMPIKDILELLDRQNSGLENNWIIVKDSENRDATSTYFAALIRDGTLRVLRTLNFKPFCGLGQATVRLVEEDCREEGDQERLDDFSQEHGCDADKPITNNTYPETIVSQARDQPPKLW